MLLQYTTGGCPVNAGRDWAKEEIHAEVMRVPHESNFSDDTIANFSAYAKGKVASKWARLVLYDDIKGNIPKQMKVSPIAAIPHKFKVFRSILDLSFLLKLTLQGRVPSVNEESEKTDPGGAIDQIGNVLLHLIRAFVEAQEGGQYFSGKMGYQGWFLEAILQGVRRMEFLI